MYDVKKARRETECRACHRIIKLRNHIILLDNTKYCLKCGLVMLKSHRDQYRRKIIDINTILRKIKRMDKELILLSLQEDIKKK